MVRVNGVPDCGASLAREVMSESRGPGRPRGRQPQLWLRVSQQILDELETLVPRIQEHPNFRARTVTVQDVARLALSPGIETLKRG
jgi:hypothetical protein